MFLICARDYTLALGLGIRLGVDPADGGREMICLILLGVIIGEGDFGLCAPWSFLLALCVLGLERSLRLKSQTAEIMSPIFGKEVDRFTLFKLLKSVTCPLASTALTSIARVVCCIAVICARYAKRSN